MCKLTPRGFLEMFDSCRGFAFVVFKTVEGLKDAVSAEEHTVKGKKVDRTYENVNKKCLFHH